ncbi:hypothetical protein J6590_012788 [Homalodisca vitripennis]|nr:hypothetical protein J6590_012788 [Homalodisca vitripennis]
MEDLPKAATYYKWKRRRLSTGGRHTIPPCTISPYQSPHHFPLQLPSDAWPLPQYGAKLVADRRCRNVCHLCSCGSVIVTCVSAVSVSDQNSEITRVNDVTERWRLQLVEQQTRTNPCITRATPPYPMLDHSHHVDTTMLTASSFMSHITLFMPPSLLFV